MNIEESETSHLCDFETETYGASEPGTKWHFHYPSKCWHNEQVWAQLAVKPFTEGSLRLVYRMYDHSITEKCCIAKISKNPMEHRQVYFLEVEMQATCQQFAKEFNKHDPPKKVQFVIPYLLEFTQKFTMMGTPVLMGVEPFLEGKYSKYSNNYGFVSTEHRNTPHAFSHWTYTYTRGHLLVCDIQGVKDVYTDPQIHSVNRRFGQADLGAEGINKFFSTHKCNALCNFFGISPRSDGVCAHCQLLLTADKQNPGKHKQPKTNTQLVAVSRKKYTLPSTAAAGLGAPHPKTLMVSPGRYMGLGGGSGGGGGSLLNAEGSSVSRSSSRAASPMPLISYTLYSDAVEDDQQQQQDENDVKSSKYYVTPASAVSVAHDASTPAIGSSHKIRIGGGGGRAPIILKKSSKVNANTDTQSQIPDDAKLIKHVSTYTTVQKPASPTSLKARTNIEGVKSNGTSKILGNSTNANTTVGSPTFPPTGAYSAPVKYTITHTTGDPAVVGSQKRPSLTSTSNTDTTRHTVQPPTSSQPQSAGSAIAHDIENGITSQTVQNPQSEQKAEIDRLIYKLAEEEQDVMTLFKPPTYTTQKALDNNTTTTNNNNNQPVENEPTYLAMTYETQQPATVKTYTSSSELKPNLERSKIRPSRLITTMESGVRVTPASRTLETIPSPSSTTPQWNSTQLAPRGVETTKVGNGSTQRHYFEHYPLSPATTSTVHAEDGGTKITEHIPLLPASPKCFDLVRFREKLLTKHNTEPPYEFLCPLSNEIMEDPVKAADDITYDRKGITEWLLHNTTSPTTHQQLRGAYVTKDVDRAERISKWVVEQCMKHLLPFPTNFNCEHIGGTVPPASTIARDDIRTPSSPTVITFRSTGIPQHYESITPGSPTRILTSNSPGRSSSPISYKTITGQSTMMSV